MNNDMSSEFREGGFGLGDIASKWISPYPTYVLVLVVALIVILIMMLFWMMRSKKSGFMPTSLSRLQTVSLSGSEALTMPTADECAAKPITDDPYSWQSQNIGEAELPPNPSTEPFVAKKSDAKLSRVLAGY